MWVKKIPVVYFRDTMSTFEPRWVPHAAHQTADDWSDRADRAAAMDFHHPIKPWLGWFTICCQCLAL